MKARSIQERNVELLTTDYSVIAGFWQHGNIDWTTFYGFLNRFFRSRSPWMIFDYDPSIESLHGAKRPPCNEIVAPGKYIVLSEEGKRIHGTLKVGSVPSRTKPTPCNTPTHPNDYRKRTQARDGMCLVSGPQTNYMDLEAIHIFPQAYVERWILSDYPSKITDTAEENYLGGSSKIDSVQNMITLRSDLCKAWANYEFGVDPNENYRITVFTKDNADIDGGSLHLDHILDKTLRPLDELFLDHFSRCIIKHVQGTPYPLWSDDDSDPDQSDDDNYDRDLSEDEGFGEADNQVEIPLDDMVYALAFPHGANVV